MRHKVHHTSVSFSGMAAYSALVASGGCPGRELVPFRRRRKTTMRTRRMRKPAVPAIPPAIALVESLDGGISLGDAVPVTLTLTVLLNDVVGLTETVSVKEGVSETEGVAEEDEESVAVIVGVSEGVAVSDEVIETLALTETVGEGELGFPAEQSPNLQLLAYLPAHNARKT